MNQRQFEFNAGSFIAQFLNFSGSGAIPNPYQATYRKLGENKNTRIGLGVNLNIDGGEADGTNIVSSINFRTGKERFTDFGLTKNSQKKLKRWRAFYGVDAKFFINYSSFSASDTQSFSIGVGPSAFFGLMFQINNRLSLSTETSYDFIFSFRDALGKSRFGLNSFYFAPTALFLGYRF